MISLVISFVVPLTILSLVYVIVCYRTLQPKSLVFDYHQLKDPVEMLLSFPLVLEMFSLNFILMPILSSK